MASAAVLPVSRAARVTRDFSFVENEDWSGSLADDEVALPMAGLSASIDRFRAIVDGDAVPDGVARRSGPAGSSAFVTMGEIAPELLALLGCPIDEGIDGLAANAPQTKLVAGSEPAGDLLRRPSFRQTVADEGPQGRVFFQNGLSRSAQQVGAGGVKRRVAPAWQSVAPQLTGHGRFCPAEGSGNRANRLPRGMQNGDLVSFSVR